TRPCYGVREPKRGGPELKSTAAACGADPAQIRCGVCHVWAVSGPQLGRHRMPHTPSAGCSTRTPSAPRRGAAAPHSATPAETLGDRQMGGGREGGGGEGGEEGGRLGCFVVVC